MEQAALLQLAFRQEQVLHLKLSYKAMEQLLELCLHGWLVWVLLEHRQATVVPHQFSSVLEVHHNQDSSLCHLVLSNTVQEVAWVLHSK